MKKSFCSFVLLFLLCIGAFAQSSSVLSSKNPDQKPVYLDVSAKMENRIEDLLSRLTLVEKIHLLHGNVISNKDAPGDRFWGGGVERLNIPKISFLDGRQGVRTFDGTLTTALPCTLSLSCTWDEKAGNAYGALLAEEMLAVKSQVLFAPMINLIRTPLNGRNFENLGEDPYLAGRMAVSYIRGVQGKKVAACACLLAANDYEANRHYTSSDMDDRTLREVHMLPYEMASREGNVWTMMSSNSLLNGIHCAQNYKLLQEFMKDDVGYQGVMLTDWRAAYDAVPTALAGTDMTTGICAYVFGDGKLLQAVKDGLVSQSLIDDKARRVIRLYIETGMLNPEILDKGSVDTEAHRAIARRLGAEGMVLLKNERNLLPLNLTRMHNIMITGPGTDIIPKGSGSGDVHSGLNISPLQGFHAALDGKANLIPVPWKAIGKNSPVNVTEMEKKAATADAVIFFATSAKYSEGSVLKDMELPDGQADAIDALIKANKNVIVVLMTGSAVSVEPWAEKVPAILGAWFAGQATGEAIADILLGKVNPGGKLSFTMAKQLSDYSVHHFGEWPARLILDKEPGPAPFEPSERKAIHAYSGAYKEGVFVGHRWFDKNNIEPRFPFGFGLSYTSFSISELKTSVVGDQVKISCKVKNTGKLAGSEVVQVYVESPVSSVPRPVRELKGFSKVYLAKGETRIVEISIPTSRLTYYDEGNKNWKLEAGRYVVRVGNSSRNLPLKSNVEIKEPKAFKFQN